MRMLLFLFRLLSRLPLSWLHGLGRVLGVLVYLLPGRYRDRLRANAAQAGYDDRAFGVNAPVDTGTCLMELQRFMLANEDIEDCVGSDNEHVAQAAMAENRVILYFTPHLGCFEITARLLVLMAPLPVMFRPPR